MKTIKASVAIKSADIILEQKGSCSLPIYINCRECPLGAANFDCAPIDSNPEIGKFRVKLLNELRGK